MARAKLKDSEVSYGCQQVLLHPDVALQGILEFICEQSNKLYNCATYYARQIFFKTHQYSRKFELDKQMKSNKHFQVLCAQAARANLSLGGRSLPELQRAKQLVEKRSTGK